MSAASSASSAPPSSALVLGEVQSLLTALRRNRKWQTDPLEYNGHNRNQPAGSLTHSLAQLRHKLTAASNQSIDPPALVAPFLAVVSSAETSGHLTALALQSLHRLLSLPALFPATHASSCAAAIRAIVSSLSHCRYESTDSSKDELVLSELLALVTALLHSPASSPHLTSDLLWSLHKTTYRIYRYMRPTDYSELLCNQAEQTLVALVKHIYGEPGGGDSGEGGEGAERYGVVRVQMMEFICTLAEISHADVGFVYSLSQGLPVPPYLNTASSSPAATSSHSSSSSSAASHPVTAPVPASPTVPSSSSSSQSSANAYFPSRRILLPSSDLLDLGLLTLPPPPLSLPSSHFTSPVALSKAVTEWTRRTVFATQLLQAVLDSPPLTSPHLLSLIDDCVCKFLLRNCRTQQSVLYAATLRCFYSLVLTYRHRLHMQIEVMLNTVYLRFLHSKSNSNVSVDASSSSAYDLKELTMESLLDLCRLPWWWSELYINYDSRLSSSNLYENLIRSLCKSVFPVHGCMTANHVLAMRCLLEGLKHNSTSHVTIAHPSDHNRYVQLLSDLRATRQYKRLLQSCVDEFNKKPKRGIALLQSSLSLFLSFDQLKLLIRKDDAALITAAQRAELSALAAFLRYTPGLDKTMIGQFIAEPGPASAMLLEEYLMLFDFHGQSLDDALRMFIEAFRLPVEAQQIDRVLQAFALQYYRHNPTLLANADVVHTLAFSLIMLNTDAHNDQIRNKMTLEQFISNNRGINAGSDVPRQLLEGLYFTIKKREIKMSGDGLTGDVSDALWCDLLSVGKHWMESRPYIRLDRLADEIGSFAATDPLSPPQLINGHIIGCTLYRPPGPLPTTTILKDGLPESPLSASRQVTLSELTRATSSNDSTPSIYTLTVRDSGSGAGVSVAWMEEDMFVEGWTAAIAALSMVYDLLQVDTHGHGMVESAADITEDDDGWNKVDSSKQSNTTASTTETSLSSASASTSTTTQPEEEDDENLLSYLHLGFTLLASVAAEYNKCHIMDKLVSSLCNLTGLPGDYRSDSSHSSTSSGSNPSYGSPLRSPTQSARAPSPLLRFSSQPKAQWSLTLLFSLLHSHMNTLRESWKDVMVCVLQLQSMNILPAGMLRLDDHVGWLEEGGVRLKGRSWLLTQLGVAVAVEERPSAVSALLSSMSSYFMYGGSVTSVEETASRSADEAEAERRVRECVEKCNIGTLLRDSKKMQAEPLAHLLSAMVDIVPVAALREQSAEPKRKPTDSVPKGRGEARVCAGVEEGEGYELSVVDEDAVMVTSSVYASESDKDKVGELFGSATGFECHSLLTTATAVEVRRVLLCHQLLNEVVSHNVDRMDDMWPHIRNYLIALITPSATNATFPALSHTSPPHPASSLGRSSSTSSLAPIRESSSIEARSATPSPLSPPPHHSSKSASYGSAGGVTGGGAVSFFVVESAVTSLFSITARLLTKPALTSDVLSFITTLSSFNLSHNAPSTQLLAGLLSVLRVHSPLFSSPQFSAVLELLSSSATYHHTYMLGWSVLSDVLQSHRGRHITLHSLADAAKAVLVFGTSRWCSAAMSSTVVEMLWQLYERAKQIVREERDAVGSTHSMSNGDGYATPLKRAQAASHASYGASDGGAQPALPFSLPPSSPVSVLRSSASMRPFQQLWQQLCFPLLSAYRTLITSFTTRIRLLHSAHLRASRSSGPGVGGGTHYTPAPAPATSDPAPASPAPAARSVVSYRGFIGYVQGFGDGRRKALVQLRQILILDDFSALVCDTATQQATQHTPHVPDHSSLSSAAPTPPASTHHPLLSLTSTSFWQHTLDTVVFPALSALAAPHPIDIELTDDLTTARSHCITLLEKIFLLHLPLLLRWEGAESGGTGFSACWLHVLKSMDGLMQLGLRRERVMMERHKRSVYDRKRERRRSEQRSKADDNSTPTHSAAASSGDEWDGLDGGVLLTESVEEALKNLLLVMKASRVFGLSSGAGGGVLNGELWELTWAIVDPVFPHLKLALFPEMQQLHATVPQPTPTPTPAQPAAHDAPAVDTPAASAPASALSASREKEGSEPSLSLSVAALEGQSSVAEESQAAESVTVEAGDGSKDAADSELKQQADVTPTVGSHREGVVVSATGAPVNGVGAASVALSTTQAPNGSTTLTV